MNNWVIVGIIVGLLLIGGITLVSAISTSADKTDAGIKCSSCGGTCTQEKNCGLTTCGAVNGGKCNCGR
jgi:hypothetical protein